MLAAFAVCAIFCSKQWFTIGLSKAVVCAVPSVGKVPIKDPLLLIGKSSLSGDSRFQCALEASLNKANFQDYFSIYFLLVWVSSGPLSYLARPCTSTWVK